MQRVNDVGLLNSVAFTTPGGAQVNLDAAGMTTRIHVTTGTVSRIYQLAGTRVHNDNFVLVTKSGEAIVAGPADAPNVAAVLQANAVRQKREKMTLAFVGAAFGFLAVTILIVVLANASA